MIVNKKKLAKEIADYITELGTSKTTSGNYHIFFKEINRLFRVSLPEDDELLKEICDAFDMDIVADYYTDEDFDMNFYLAYCPNYEPEEWWH